MTAIRLLSLSAAAVLLTASTAAYVTYDAQGTPAAGDSLHSSFGAEVRGDVVARLVGAAEFGAVSEGEGAGIFSITLGARDSGGAVIFTRTDGRPLGPGSYVVSDRGEGTDVVRALVVTGPSWAPTGAFRGWSGMLTVTSTSESWMAGAFDLHATGFLARDPDDEDRRITVSGSFTAVRSPSPTPALAAGDRRVGS